MSEKETKKKDEKILGIARIIKGNNLLKIVMDANELMYKSSTIVQTLTANPCCEVCLSHASYILGQSEAIRGQLRELGTYIGALVQNQEPQ